jgi:hypothetical protein
MQDLTKIDKPFGELDDKTAIALFAAWKKGAKIECNTSYDRRWGEIPEPRWYPECSYRVKSVPLVPDSIDWSHVHAKWKWLARDRDGEVYIYTDKPYRDAGLNFWLGGGAALKVLDVFTSYKQGTAKWEDSLVERPNNA